MAEIYIEKCRDTAVIPAYAHPGDAGMDIYAAADVIVEPGKSVLVPTGLKMAIPVGYEVQIRPRSGISLKTPLRVPNAPGTIASGSRDDATVLIYPPSPRDDSAHGEPYSLNTKGCMHGTYKICCGDRIAQMVIAKVEECTFNECADVSAIGENRGGGFGSSGI